MVSTQPPNFRSSQRTCGKVEPCPNLSQNSCPVKSLPSLYSTNCLPVISNTCITLQQYGHPFFEYTKNFIPNQLHSIIIAQLMTNRVIQRGFQSLQILLLGLLTQSYSTSKFHLVDQRYLNRGRQGSSYQFPKFPHLQEFLE